uniref:ATP synthase complex subunit 8 n=1 Tax=Aiceona himalaica TaxID=1064607 RepID=A0A1L1YMY2_9HEMI|nr:ATP synthase subunit 8 [Aiceona himalaica]
MAPMNWMLLFLMFLLTFSILMNLNYFYFNKLMKKKNLKKFYKKNYNKFI